MFVYFYLCWDFVSLQHRLSLVVANRGHSLGVVCRLLVVVWLLLLQSAGSRARASVVAAHELVNCGSWALKHSLVVVAHRLSCSVACGIFPDQGSNPRLLCWQADSLPLSQHTCTRKPHVFVISFIEVSFSGFIIIRLNLLNALWGLLWRKQ